MYVTFETHPSKQASCSYQWFDDMWPQPPILSHLCLTGSSAALIMPSWREPQEGRRKSPRAGSESGLLPSPAPPSSVSQPQRAHCSGDRACHAVSAMATGALHLSTPQCFCPTSRCFQHGLLFKWLKSGIQHLFSAFCFPLLSDSQISLFPVYILLSLLLLVISSYDGVSPCHP